MENQVLKSTQKSPSKDPPKTKPKGSTAGNSALRKYFIAYNAVNLLLWSMVTLRALLLIPILLSMNSLHSLLQAIFPYLKYTQSIMILEVFHALFGLVRANPITTLIQVGSRLIIVWAVLAPYPEIVVQKTLWGGTIPGATGGPAALAAICTAWGITEVIRYGFFLWKEGVSEKVPEILTWLRYNTFFVLYPIGISGEWWLMYLATTPASRGKQRWDWVFKFFMFLWIPGGYIMYTHMMSQRRKVMKGKNKTS